MRLLAITSVCACALLLGCTRGGVGTGPTVVIKLPCPGKDKKTGDHLIDNATTVRFKTGGNCKFIDPERVSFDPPNNPYPLGFSNRVVDPGGTEISYDYDPSKPIPTAGYGFSYRNDDPQDGNGSGVVKN